MKKITVIGAGTSGLVSSLMLNTLSDIEVEIIHNPKKGIIGVGEGTTEHIDLFFTLAEIDPVEFLVETEGSIKAGVSFRDWNFEGDEYIHALLSHHHSNYNIQSLNLPDLYFPFSKINNKPLTDMHGFITEDSYINLTRYNGIVSLTDFYQQHFDSFKVYEYLVKLCAERNIKIIEDNIIDFRKNNNDEIITLKGEKTDYHVDFIVDCSGLDKTILKRAYPNDIKFIDLTDYLPCDSAMVTMTHGEYKEAYTIAKGMKSGWLWRIPTRVRHGNGYVFNSNISSKQEILEEFNQTLNTELEDARIINWDVGHLNKCFHKNVMSIGMACAFFEPIEASTIGVIITMCQSLRSLIKNYFRGFNISHDINEQYINVINNVYLFLKFHYNTKRNDTEFWRYTQNLKQLDWEEALYEKWKYRYPHLDDGMIFNRFGYNLYNEYSFILVGTYNNFFSDNIFKNLKEDHQLNIEEVDFPISYKKDPNHFVSLLKIKTLDQYYEYLEDYLKYKDERQEIRIPTSLYSDLKVEVVFGEKETYLYHVPGTSKINWNENIDFMGNYTNGHKNNPILMKYYDIKES